MKKFFLLLTASVFLVGMNYGQLTVNNLRCENRINPIGIDAIYPRFSWQIQPDQRGLMQAAYEIRLGYKSGKNDIWKSGKQVGSQSVYVPYTGRALESAKAYYWQVRIWDNKGRGSAWSEKAFCQMGLVKADDWKAKWIESGSAADTVNGPVLLFRKEFTSGKKIISAIVFITSHGMYEAFINGKRIGDAFLTPGWTSYNKRLQYQVYDVTAMIEKGKNAIGVNIGSGWYRTALAWNNNRNIYGRKIGLLLQLEINYADGSRETIVSDGSWKTSNGGPVRISEIYDGETDDASHEKPGWNKSGYDDREWQSVVEKDYPKNNLVATYNEPIRKHEMFHPVRIFKTPKGEQVIDFGQNLVGWAQLR